jgi:hypothetical protein
MLASITPLGERGRQSRWGVTVTAFALGATAAGAAAGAVLGAIGAVAVPAGGAVRWGLLLAALAAAIAIDAAPRPVPGPRRQVNRGWLDRYRGWVYGLGYGAQLGLAVTTVVNSAATYAALLAALLTRSAPGGALVIGCYGAVRGLTLLAAARVRNPGQLVAIHAALERRRGFVRCAAIGGLGAAAGTALVGALA